MKPEAVRGKAFPLFCLTPPLLAASGSSRE
jgi:hypothetical protein